MRADATKLQDMPSQYVAGYLDKLDGRTAFAADMRARWAAITDDLGGEAALSYVLRSLVERCLWIEHWIATQERALAEGRAAAFR